jgi:coiled-coil and C2 domain-containing protein 2A
MLNFERYQQANARLQKLVEGFGPAAFNDRVVPKFSESQEKSNELDADALTKKEENHERHEDVDDKEGEDVPLMQEYWEDNRVLAWKPTLRESEEDAMRKEFKLYGRPRKIMSAVEVGIKESLPEDEGFYTGPKFFIPRENWERFEARLLREDPDAKVFFDEEQNIICERSPLLPGSFRPAPQDQEAVAPLYVVNIEPPVKYTGDDSFYDMKMNIVSVSFSDHPLFTEEDYACAKLQEFHREWLRRKTIDLVQYYTDQIAALSAHVDLLEKKLKILAPEDPRVLFFAAKLRATLSKLLECRFQRDIEEHEQTVLFRNMYSLWRQVLTWRKAKTEELRASDVAKQQALPTVGKHPQKGSGKRPNQLDEEKQEPTVREMYIGFPLVMKVKKTLTKKEDETVRWDGLIAQEIKEHRRLFDVKLLLGDQEAREELGEFDEERESIKVHSRASINRRKPGKPIYEPVLDNQILVTPDHMCDQAERERRIEIANARLTLVLYVNKQRVVETEPVLLRFPPPYVASFNISVPLQLLSVPASITFQVYTKQVGFNPFTRSLLADAFIPIPEVGGTPAPQQFQFSGAPIVGSKHFPTNAEREAKMIKEGKTQPTLRSQETAEKNKQDEKDEKKDKNVEKKIEEEVRPPDVPRYVGGVLEVAAYWDSDAIVKLVKNNFEDFKTYWNRKVLRNNRASIMRQKRLVALTRQEGDTDPNDPRNAVLLEVIRRDAESERRAKCFRAVHLHENLMLVNPIRFHPAARKKVLRARNESPFVSKQRVELIDSEITERMYELIINEKVGDDSNANSNFSLGKTTSTQGSVLKAEVSDVKQVVREVALPQMTLFQGGGALAALLAVRTRQLNVSRVERPMVAHPKQVCIRLQLIRAQNLPMRHGGDAGDRDASNIFVELRFQQQTFVTQVRKGSSVSWNECFTLYIDNGEQALSPQYMQSLRDEIYFNFFDEQEEIARESATRDLHVHTHHWLGSFSLPFSTLYLNSMIEGRFDINVPFNLAGYRKPRPKQPTSMWLFSALHPPVPPPFAKSGLPGAEFVPFEAYCTNWVEKHKTHFPNRNFRALVDDVNSERQLCCNYICPQAPPAGLEEPASFIRWVSQIPFLEDMHLLYQAEVWCTSDAFLALASGDWEEHAVLLCNYFRHYEVTNPRSGWNSYVLLGSAVPEGNTAFVLRLRRVETVDRNSPRKHAGGRGEVTEVVLINAVTGVEVDLKRNPDFSSLYSVGVVFDSLNVWANIQNVEEPSKLDWDLFNDKRWHALFNLGADIKKYEIELNHENILKCIQPALGYLPPDPTYVKDRAFAIERILNIQFERKRAGKTRWDVVACEIYRKYLLSFENVKLGRSSKVDDTLLVPLERAYKTQYGFPLCFSESEDPAFLRNSEDNPVVNALFNTRLHENDGEHMVFALAVHIHAYPNKISTIWVYAAALVSV